MTGADFSLWMTILHSELWNRKEQSALRPEELEFSQRPVGSSVVFVMYQFTVPIWLQSAGGVKYLPDYSLPDAGFRIIRDTFAFSS